MAAAPSAKPAPLDEDTPPYPEQSREGRFRVVYVGKCGGSTAYSPTVLPGSSAFNVLEIAAGQSHVAAITCDGLVVVFGDGEKGQLGLGPELRSCAVLTHLPLPETEEQGRAKRVACGPFTTAVITDSGSCFVWGGGDDGPFAPRRVRLPESTIAMEVCCGLSHFVALVRHVVESDSASAEEDGVKGTSVVTWGASEDGALGLGDEKSVEEPKVIRFFESLQPRSIAAGYQHSAVIAANGDLYIWGNYRGKKGSNEYIPVKMRPKNAERVWCGMHGTFVQDQGGVVFSWGSSRHSPVLGVGDTKDHSSPHALNMPSGSGKAMKLAPSVEHAALLLEDGAVCVWGSSKGGRLGRESDANVTRPAILEYKFSVFDIACTDEATFMRSRTPTFGTSLEELGYLPHPLVEVIALLSDDGAVVWGEQRAPFDECTTEFCKSEGVFRLSGASDRVNALALQIDRGEEVTNFRSQSVHTLADLLKKYLLELPDPVISRRSHGAFINACADKLYTVRLERLAHQVSQLPPLHHKLLRLLVPLFHKILSFEEYNKMGAKNLGMVLLPAMLGPQCMNDFQNIGIYNRIVMTLVELGNCWFEGTESLLAKQVHWIVRQPDLPSLMLRFIREGVGKFDFEVLHEIFHKEDGTSFLVNVAWEIETPQEWASFRDLLIMLSQPGVKCDEVVVAIQEIVLESDSNCDECKQAVRSMLYCVLTGSGVPGWIKLLPNFVAALIQRD